MLKRNLTSILGEFEIKNVIDPHQPALPPTTCTICQHTVSGAGDLDSTDFNMSNESTPRESCLPLTREFVIHCVCEAIEAFLQAIRLSSDPNSLLAWKYPALNQLVLDNVSAISSSVWTRVPPQLLSRHSLKHQELLPVLQAIFSQLVDDAPSELNSSLGVSSNSTSENYSRPAKAVLTNFEHQHPVLVAESFLFIQGMRQTAIKAYTSRWVSPNLLLRPIRGETRALHPPNLRLAPLLLC